eukprot:5971700-Prymnesium_polylepis.1
MCQIDDTNEDWWARDPSHPWRPSEEDRGGPVVTQYLQARSCPAHMLPAMRRPKPLSRTFWTRNYHNSLLAVSLLVLGADERLRRRRRTGDSCAILVHAASDKRGRLHICVHRGCPQLRRQRRDAEAVRRVMSRYTLPEEVSQMAIDYLSNRWNHIKGHSKELVDATELLHQLPDPLRFEAVESMTVDALVKVPLFARVEEGFMHALAQKMVAVSATIGETLIEQGAINDA